MMSVRLFKSENRLTLLNFVTPVKKLNLMSASESFTTP